MTGPECEAYIERANVIARQAIEQFLELGSDRYAIEAVAKRIVRTETQHLADNGGILRK